MLRNLLCILTVAAVSLAAVAPAHRYTREEWLSIRARLIIVPKPEYPEVLRCVRYTGTGLFRLYFDTRGEVSGIRILKSTGHKELDIETLKALIRWRAKPGSQWELDLPVTFVIGYRPRTYSPIDRW
ncbi:MAG: hypothetical protein DLM73_08735 [Chthoniobacterales bacterium]|nr:MAG: hypothetical protein DLM73_08735 [Chthoniobacterales bacterium]